MDDDRNRIRAGLEDGLDVSGGDPSYGHEWKFRGNVPDRAQLLKSHCRIVILFGAGRKNGSESDVVDWQSHSCFQLLLSVGGETNQRIVLNQTTRGFDWQVVLSKVEPRAQLPLRCQRDR